MQFSFPIGPSKAEMTPQQFKARLSWTTRPSTPLPGRQAPPRLCASSCPLLIAPRRPDAPLSAPAQLGSCLDFLSDVLYFLPVVWACWRFGLHGSVWPKLGAFCALQVSVGARGRTLPRTHLPSSSRLLSAVPY